MRAGYLEAFVVNGNDSDKGGWIQLPIRKEDFLEAVAAIGATDPDKDSLTVTMVEPEWEVLTRHLNEPFDLNELNFLASKLVTLQDRDEETRNAFAANLQAGQHCGSVAEMINLLENIDSFTLQPAFSPEQYGAFQIEIARDEFAERMNSLEQSSDIDDQSFCAYIAGIEAHVDLRSYGKYLAEMEGGVFTDYGYLEQTGGFEDVYHGIQDIPAEFQVSPFREPQPLLKLEKADLTEALTKLHTVTGHADDLDRNLATLHRRRSAEFLLLLTENKAVLSEAMHIYREGTPAYNAFVEPTEAKMFSIYVTDFQTDFIGDIREVDASMRRADILEHSMDFVSVEVVAADGKNLILTPEEWNTVSQAERDAFQSATRQFSDGDYSKMFRHVEHQSDWDGRESKAASADKFLAKLEQEFPSKEERAPETRPRSVLAQIASTRAEPHKKSDPAHRAGTLIPTRYFTF